MKEKCLVFEENNVFHDQEIYHHIAISKQHEKDIEKIIECDLFLPENQNDDIHEIIEKDYCSNKYLLGIHHFIQADHLSLKEHEQKNNIHRHPHK